MTGQPWQRSHRADRPARLLADRHYNRQRVGAQQFVPPGRALVLITADLQAVWVTSYPYAEYVRHAWAGAMVCSLFRREGGPQASTLIRAACAATAAEWPPPPLGMVSFVDAAKTRPIRGRCSCSGPDDTGCPFDGATRVTGWTYIRAGFHHAGLTAGGLVAVRLRPEEFPAPLPARPFGGQMALDVE